MFKEKKILSTLSMHGNYTMVKVRKDHDYGNKLWLGYGYGWRKIVVKSCQYECHS